jgi:hypothetical protein
MGTDGIGMRGLGNGGGLRSKSHANLGSGGGNFGTGNVGSGSLGFGSVKLQLKRYLLTPSTATNGVDAGPPGEPDGGH